MFQLFPYQILSHSFWYKICRSGQFLSETYVKAGVSPDAWKHGAKLEAFTAEVFGE
jgi:AMMECR1 domain-containing protein